MSRICSALHNSHEEPSELQADKLVNDLRTAFEELLQESTWMDASTQVITCREQHQFRAISDGVLLQVLAKEKAEMMLQLVGYPDWLPDKAELDKYYEGVRERSHNLFCDSV